MGSLSLRLNCTFLAPVTARAVRIRARDPAGTVGRTQRGSLPQQNPPRAAGDASVSTQPARGFPSGNAEFPSRGRSPPPGWADTREVRTGEILVQGESIPSPGAEQLPAAGSQQLGSRERPSSKISQGEQLGQQEQKTGLVLEGTRGQPGPTRSPPRSPGAALPAAPCSAARSLLQPASPRRGPGALPATRWRPAQPRACRQRVLLLYSCLQKWEFA